MEGHEAAGENQGGITKGKREGEGEGFGEVKIGNQRAKWLVWQLYINVLFLHLKEDILD